MTALTHCPLRRFVADGLRATIDSYAAGTLPLHRFTWELDSRLTTLAELSELPRRGSLATLCVARKTITAIDRELRATGRGGLTAAEKHTLAAAVTALRTELIRFAPSVPSTPTVQGAPIGRVDPARALVA
jgi:hypothetical protein